KPDPVPYLNMVERFGISPERAAMFEDSVKNLIPAADMGMMTVWVHHPNHDPGPHDAVDHCQYVTDDLTGWLAAAVKE
ncbi:MAG: HAD family hydrolase, partial [Rhodobacteraceae bacterium]|nr:HAD family hydrolase [Paracoccaceae bacterium]